MPSEKKLYAIINIDLKTFIDSVKTGNRDILIMRSTKDRRLFVQMIEDMNPILGKKTLVKYKNRIWEAQAGAEAMLIEVKLDLEK